MLSSGCRTVESVTVLPISVVPIAFSRSMEAKIGGHQYGETYLDDVRLSVEEIFADGDSETDREDDIVDGPGVCVLEIEDEFEEEMIRADIERVSDSERFDETLSDSVMDGVCESDGDGNAESVPALTVAESDEAAENDKLEEALAVADSV